MLIIASCVSEEEPVEIPISDAQKALEDAKAWFGLQEEFVVPVRSGENARVSNQIKKIYWNKSITHDNGKVIEVAIKYSAHSVPIRDDSTVVSLKEKQKRSFYRLIIRKDSLGNYSKSILKFFPEQNVKDQSDLEVNNFMSLSSQLSGDIQLTDWDENLEKGWYVMEGIPVQAYFPEPVSGKKRVNFAGASLDCTVTVYQICEFEVDDEEVMECLPGTGCVLPSPESECYLVYSTSGCDEEDTDEGGPGWYGGSGGGGPTGPTPGGGSGSGSGGTGGPTLLPEDEIGIDCDSFNFKDIGSNWQEAGVINIRFDVRIVGGGVRTMTINRALYFGMPKELISGEIFSKLDAANFATSAVQRASDLAHHLYLFDASTSETTVIAAFMTLLKSQMSLYGGRADY